MKIAYIDDKDFSLQIKKSMPSSLKYEFHYFSSYKEALGESFDIIFLDYYLDLDWVKSVEIVHNLCYKICIWFSSSIEKSAQIAKKTNSKYFCAKENGDDFNFDIFTIISLILEEVDFSDYN